MAKAINSIICFQRIHEAARKEYLGENKHGDAYQVMLNAEQQFLRWSKDRTIPAMVFYHDMLVRKRVEAERVMQSR